MCATAARLDARQRECGFVNVALDEFGASMNFGLVEVVYEWARGLDFSTIMRLTDVQEGIIVRTIQRLDELCRDVRNAAALVGHPSLPKTMEETSLKIKRDIVFASSLYTTGS